MHRHLLSEFSASGDTLRVYEDRRLVFSSDKGRLLPLLDYIERFNPGRPGAAIFDKMVGNAAALLAVLSGCREVYSPLGSRLAVGTLEGYGVKYRLAEVVPFIQQPGGDMCPMERLSMGKTPQQFYQALQSLRRRDRISGGERQI